MKSVRRQESITELTILKPAILVLVIAAEKVADVLYVGKIVENLLEALLDLVGRNPALALNVKDPESIN